ncbi:uracil-DNA glycosylase family protein [Lentilactobacillus otakiensis]|jgi:uracil-DNA glycosylase|uniref:Uracil-DNA glycosylase family protein n=1 Tax=Lentilactobacillus otakiensis DSM 19908 = JCM 15040 TaxID=1423780 RepID=S4NMK6_9LACO|nr:uracil-DNA glycosylase family protein [Lentilactobacillus otakiensis]KRL12059.1 uracil-DNA glycosylase family protein [Lentilactobacillus otakiensis DSM 19908 = JCM 15040]MBZ3776548.1 uracil-DNA glycosylase family protein [Lentilactobacillus otakiensis]MDV3517397.1 uracil-DNA glycosylase family protein [Lentilactobacillus otakiensis]GAD17096.1 uracil-DNA glycosylase family protein [Lentilactobacillus otakiensis DSM 19908 = JCM 15040]
MKSAKTIFKAIQADPQNKQFTSQGILPLYHVDPKAEILIISQAPSRKAQESMVFWDDPSGDRLRDWMGLSKDEFYRSGKIAVLPLDFYYPGKGAHGDLPPRKGFAEKWHAPLLALMPNIKVKLLIGQYAQKYYLGKSRERNLTETVRHFDQYLPEYFPLVHPSPLNYGWMKQHPWFKDEVVPALRKNARGIIDEH